MLSFLFSPTLTSIHDYWINHAATAKSLQSCPTLCDPIDSSPPGSSVPGILQARALEWVAVSFSNAWKWKVKSESKVAQSCPTLRDLMDCSLPGSSRHGIFRARVLEWVVIAFVSKVMSLLFNMLSRLVIAFLPRSKHLLVSWLQSSSAVILEPPQNKVCHCFHCFPIYLPWSDGTWCHDLSFLQLGALQIMACLLSTFIFYLLKKMSIYFNIIKCLIH